MRTAEDILRPPTEAEVEAALKRFAADVRRHYGDRLKGLYLFGSRARGDHRPDSDADVAVILRDPPWDFWPETRALAGLSYDRLVDDGVEIQGWPVPDSSWRDPDRHHCPSLIRAICRDARPLGDSGLIVQPLSDAATRAAVGSRRVSQLWKKALQTAEDARLLFRRGGHIGAVSLAYSAAFTAARALLVERAGCDETEVRRHAAVLRLLSDHFVSANLLDPEIARGFQSLSLARASADYGPEISSEEDSHQALQFMERFLSRVSQLRDQEPNP